MYRLDQTLRCPICKQWRHEVFMCHITSQVVACMDCMASAGSVILSVHQKNTPEHEAYSRVRHD